MITEKERKNIYLVLVPHRDTRLVLRNYSAELFRAGYFGAFCFPWTAPLAQVSRPLTDAELKHCAGALRESIGSKIRADRAEICAFQNAAIFGPLIDIGGLRDWLGSAAEKATETFPRPVIGTCLLQEAEAGNAALPPLPELSFSAAALANMHWKHADEGGAFARGAFAGGAFAVKWKIGSLCWLPKLF